MYMLKDGDNILHSRNDNENHTLDLLLLYMPPKQYQRILLVRLSPHPIMCREEMIRIIQTHFINVK